MAQLGKTDISLMIETAGKVGQMGSVDMILDVASTVKGVGPCIDFGHVHARSLGELETPDAMAQAAEAARSFGSVWAARISATFARTRARCTR